MNKFESMSFRKDFVLPVEEQDRMLGFIKWGKKNDYPYFLVDLFNGSAWHQGIIKNKTHYIAGGGIEVVTGNLQRFLENPYSDFTMDEIVEQLAFDYELFGAFAVKGTWNKEGTRVVRWEYLAVDMIRISADERMYYLSDDWTVQQQSAEKTNLRTISALDENNKVGSFIIYYKDPAKKGRKEQGVYPKPPYNGGITAIQTDVDISKFHMYELQNGFKSGTMITFMDGFPETQEEAESFKNQIKGPASNIENSGDIIITFAPSADQAPKVESLTGNDLDKRYESLESSVQQNILVAHAVVAPSLFGVAPEGSFNAAESAELFEIFKKTYVDTRQRRLEWMLNYMIELSGDVGTVKLKDVKPIGVAETAPVATTPGAEAPVDVAKSALNGAQIASLIDVVAKIKEGILTPDSALQVLLASFPTIDEAQARRIVGINSPQIMSSCKHNFDDDDIGYFAQYGESANKYNTIMSFSIPWDTPMDEVFKKQDEIFATIGQVTVGGEGSKGLGKNDGGSEFEVRYKYQQIPGIPPVKTQSRAFCIKLIELNRLYTRQEIETISLKLGYDVWRYRGGWYTNPDTGKTTPWCRHEWVQQLVIAKAGTKNIEVVQPEVKTNEIKITTSKEGAETAIEFFKESTGIQMKIGKVAENIDPEKMQISLTEVKNILREYKISNTIEDNAELSFKTTSGAYGVVWHRGGQISEINLGQNVNLRGAVNTDATKRFEIVLSKQGRYLTQRNNAHVDEINIDKYVATHEMGHVIALSQNPNSAAYFAKLKPIFSQYKKEMQQSVINNDIKNLNEISLGGYARTNLNEFHAEAFSEYRLSSTPGKYAKLVGKLIDQHFKK